MIAPALCAGLATRLEAARQLVLHTAWTEEFGLAKIYRDVTL